MAFLYSTYVVIYRIASLLLVCYIDSVHEATGGSDGGGVQFTALHAVLYASAFVPEGAVSFTLHPADAQR